MTGGAGRAASSPTRWPHRADRNASPRRKEPAARPLRHLRSCGHHRHPHAHVPCRPLLRRGRKLRQRGSCGRSHGVAGFGQLPAQHLILRSARRYRQTNHHLTPALRWNGARVSSSRQQKIIRPYQYLLPRRCGRDAVATLTPVWDISDTPPNGPTAHPEPSRCCH